MSSLGFENYAEALKIYLTKYREVRAPSCPRLLFLRYGSTDARCSSRSRTGVTTNRTGPTVKATITPAARILPAASRAATSGASRTAAMRKPTVFMERNLGTTALAESIDPNGPDLTSLLFLVFCFCPSFLGLDSSSSMYKYGLRLASSAPPWH